MKFYNREEQLARIQKALTDKSSDFMYISGRRRVWKTSLIQEALKDTKHLYFFIPQGVEGVLLNTMNKVIQSYFNLKNMSFDSIRDIFQFLFDQAEEKGGLVIVFDEFQKFFDIDDAIFPFLQDFWDRYNKKTNIKLFCLGSHFTLMKKIFEDKREPLYQRHTWKIYLKWFDIKTQVQILKDYNILTQKNLLYFYWIIGWVPKYIDILLKEWNLKKDTFMNDMIETLLRPDWFFLAEWRELLTMEFGRSNNIYFSILKAISLWKTKKNEIADYIWKSQDSIGVYLNKLEKYYEIIQRRTAIEDDKETSWGRYMIVDNFLQFWFRYVLNQADMIELRNFDWLRDSIMEDISNVAWFYLEKLMKDIFIEYNLQNKLPFSLDKIGTYFDRWSNEIDIICMNKKQRKVLFVECKLDQHRIWNYTVRDLKQKVVDTKKFKTYTKYYGVASLDKINYAFEDKEVLTFSVEEYLEDQNK